jgi:hypothetical protein
VDLVLFVFTTGLILILKFQIAPVVGPLTYSAEGQDPVTKEMPAFFDTIAPEFDASFTVTVPQIRVSVFAVQVDDCIESLMVNDVRVIPSVTPVLCSPHEFSRLNLGPFLRTGTNTITMRVSDTGVTGGVEFVASNTDPMLIFLQLAAFFCIGWFALRLRAAMSERMKPSVSMMALLFGGVFLRIIYANATSYNLRAHDMEGHVDYILYVARNVAIPNAADGWEFHQPPLYYGLGAAWYRAAEWLGVPHKMILESLSGASVALSVIALCLMFAVGRRLFGRGRGFMWYALLTGSAAGLLLLTPNITNEALAIPCSVLLLWLLIRWWQDGGRLPVLLMAAAFSLSFITKISVLLFVPVLLSCFLLHPRLTLRRRIASLVLFGSMAAFLAGWYPAYRFFLEPSRQKTMTLGNDGMDHGLMVPRDAKHLFTFNPVEMVRHPYNNPWDDEARRGYFAEYFFKSALFGEFAFERLQPLAYPLIVLALLMLIPFSIGFVREVTRSFAELWPLHITTACLFAGAFLYPYFFPFSPNQDFRFSVVLTVPVAFYAVRGVLVIPRTARWIFTVVMALFVALSAVFYGATFFLS